MKNLIILIILGVAGYFGYQYFIGSSQQDSTPATPTYEYLLSLPEQCQEAGKIMEDAFYRKKKGEIKKTRVNGYAQDFRRCLKSAGFTDPQRDEAYDRIADSADYKGW